MPKQSKSRSKDAVSKAAEQENDKHILGGLKDPTGDTRSAGLASSNTDQITNLKIPFGDKQIVCERHHAPKRQANGLSLVFTHGAGGGIENPATRDFVTGFASASQSDALCFQGTMNLVNRTKTFHAVLKDQGKARALGGRSMGSRAAVITATECAADMRPEALVLVSYPLTSEKPAKSKKGKEGEADPRKQILLDLPAEVDVLFVIGSRDGMCDLSALEEVRKEMKTKSWVMEVKNADHGMSFTPKAGVQPMRLRTGELAAEWLEKRDEKKTHCSAEWSKDDEKVVFSGWRDRLPEGDSDVLKQKGPKESKKSSRKSATQHAIEEDGDKHADEKPSDGAETTKPNDKTSKKRKTRSSTAADTKQNTTAKSPPRKREKK